MRFRILALESARGRNAVISAGEASLRLDCGVRNRVCALQGIDQTWPALGRQHELGHNVKHRMRSLREAFVRAPNSV